MAPKAVFIAASATSEGSVPSRTTTRLVVVRRNQRSCPFQNTFTKATRLTESKMNIRAHCMAEGCTCLSGRMPGTYFCSEHYDAGVVQVESEPLAPPLCRFANCTRPSCNGIGGWCQEHNVQTTSMAGLTTTVGSGSTELLTSLTCVHGRIGGWACPHCGLVAP